MKFLKTLLAIVFISFCPVIGFTQTVKTIDSLEESNQHCLDERKYMLGCEKHFYLQMDSMLNVVYFKLCASLSNQEKVTLKKEQKLWLKARDAYFEKTLATFKENNPGKSPYGSAFGAQDDAMFMYNDNAAFVQERVIALIKRLSQL